MVLHPPVVQRSTAPTEEEAEAMRASTDALRAEQDAAREAARPSRRAAILTGPTLRDVDAAVSCWCSCHPRPADASLHDGGTTCSCQLTPDERAARFEDWLAGWRELVAADGEPSWHERSEAQVDAEAAALGVEARIAVSAAPFVIVGLCDGRGFYLRERHGSYCVTIASDDDPGSNPWEADPTVPTIDVATGDEHDLDGAEGFSPAKALRIAVRAVRAALARNACEHRRVEDEPYCPRCGVDLTEAGTWRWSSPL